MMSFPTDSISELLAQPDVSARRAWLEAAGYFSVAGLEAMLDRAAEQMHGDTGTAVQLVQLCRTFADELNTPAIKPRATYLDAQYAAIQADFETATALISSAKADYLALGDSINAGRTTVGLMRVLGEQGNYAEAIVEAEATIVQLETADLSDQSTDYNQLLSFLHTNLCGCYLYIGDPNSALNALDRVDVLVPDPSPIVRAYLLSDRGLALLKLGRVSEAITLHETLLADVDKDASPTLYATIASNAGLLYGEVGRYTDSLRVLEEATEILSSQTANAALLLAHSNLGDVWRLLNLQPETITAYTVAEDGMRSAGMQYPLAMVLQGKGIVLARMGQHNLAISALEEAMALLEAVGNESMIGAVLVELAHIYLSLGDDTNRQKAQEMAERAATFVTIESSPIEALRVYLCQIDVSIEMGDYAAAETHLAHAKMVADEIGLAYLQYQVAYREGRLAQAQDDSAAAITAYQQAIDLVKALRIMLSQDTLRTAFLTDKLAPWNRLIDLYLAQGDEASIEKAFALVDDARAQTLVELMQGRIDRQLTHSLSDEQQSHLQTLQLRLNTIYNDLFNPNGEQRGSYAMMHERALDIEREIKQLVRRFTRRERREKRLPAKQLRETLPSNLPILAWHTNGDEIMAFIYFDGRLQIKRHVAQVSVVQTLLTQMHSQWNRMKAGQAFVKRHGDMLLKTSQRMLHKLYEALITPLKTEIPADGDLVMIPHGLLHHIPFHALYNGEKYMLDAYTISYAPSVSVFALCQQRPTPPITEALVVGVSDPALTHVAAETAAVQPHIPNATILLDESATQAAVEDRLPTIDLLHVASHALFRDDNPRFSAIRLQDAWVTARDVAEWGRAPSHVTLSACESGRSVIMGGDETIGLTRAFLSAGTSSLIVSLWLVQDETASRMMPLYYQKLRTMTASSALRHAQIAMRDLYPHPWFWAGFVAIGKRDSNDDQTS